jgi:hypothetical protein
MSFAGLIFVSMQERGNKPKRENMKRPDEKFENIED